MDPRKKNILVTGAAGLIGRCVTNKLIELGYGVVAVDRAMAGVVKHPLVKRIETDCADEKFLALLGDQKFESVVHLAAHPGGLSLEEPTENVRVNILGSMRLFEYCAKKQKRILFASSSVVYGSADYRRPVTEMDPVQPGTIYAIGKIACESFLGTLRKGLGLEWTVVRLFATYGAGHTPNLHQGILNVFLTQLSRGNHVVVKGSLDRVRDLLYVEDAAAAIVKAVMSDGAIGEIFNIGSGIGHRVEEIIALTAKAVGKNDSEIIIQELPSVVGDTFYNVADIGKAKSVLDFHPRYDLASGLREYVRDINSHF